MKKLGETETTLYFGRQKGISASIEFLGYVKDATGQRSGRPDFGLGVVKKPSFTEKKPRLMSDIEWELIKNAEHWQLARERLTELVIGIELDDCQK